MLRLLFAFGVACRVMWNVSQAQSVLLLPADTLSRSFALDAYLSLWANVAPGSTLAQARRASAEGKFQPYRYAKLLASGREHWLCFTIQNTAPRESNWALLFTNALNVNYAHIYILQADTLFATRITGAYPPASQLFFKQNRRGIYLTIAKDQTQTIFIRLYNENGYPVQSQCFMEPAQKALVDDYVKDLTQALFQGAIWLMFIYNALLAWVYRDRAYIFYLLYLWAIGVYAAFQSSLLTQVLLNEMPKIGIWCNAIAEELAVMSYIAFMYNFFEVKQEYPYFRRWFYMMGYFLLSKFALNLCVLGFSFNLYYSDMLLILPLLLIPFLLYMLPRLGRHLGRAGLMFKAGSLALILGAVLSISMGAWAIQMGQDALFVSASYLVEVAVLVEIIFFTLGMGQRYRQIEADKQAAQDETIRMQQRINEHLDTLVAERTQSLARLNEELMMRNEEINMLNDSLEQTIAAQTEELRAALEDLRRQNQELEQFSHVISHNLRAPVSRILGLASLLSEHEIPAEMRKTLQFLHKSAHNLDAVVKDLDKVLNLHYSDAELYEPVDLGEILAQTRISLEQEIQQSHADIQVRWASSPKLHSIKSHWQSIFFNLVANAIKYRDPERDLQVVIEAYIYEGEWHISIRDNGLGIKLSPSDIHQIFQPYKRMHTHVEGTGFGLYLVKSQVSSLGGQIHVSSTVGEGTTFTIRVPLPEVELQQT